MAAALAHWRDRRGVQMDITSMPGYQELSAPVRRAKLLHVTGVRWGGR